MKSDYETEHFHKGNKAILHPSVRPSVHFSMATSPARGRVGTVVLQCKAVTPWTCHQFIAGPHRDTNNHLHSHLQTILSCQVAWCACVWTEGGSQTTKTEAMQTQGEWRQAPRPGGGGPNININIDDILIICGYFFGLRSCMKNVKIGGFSL